MNTLRKSWALLLGAVFLSGCQFYARSPEDYAKETQALLATKNEDIKGCYDKVLKKDKDAAGVVAVNFKVEKKTGKVVDPTVDDAKTTAPKALTKCVTKAMEGLTLDPPDQRDGMASFEYEFKANPPRQL
ncbi:MAG TPA: AgmX/PglI C-terminal domain-containing protein [Polyangiaceae bacterium]|nr:AgmX/PglI C-terminal domain-containing protein [Polyangiaceae bacterium]